MQTGETYVDPTALWTILRDILYWRLRQKAPKYESAYIYFLSRYSEHRNGFPFFIFFLFYRRINHKLKKRLYVKLVRDSPEFTYR